MATTRKDLRGRTLRKGEMQRSSDKRYAYSYKDPLGRRKYIYANDLVTLREKETQLTKDQLDGLDIYVAGKATVNFVFDRYMSLKTNLRQTTRSNYLYMYDRFVRDTFGKKKIAVIRYSDVLQFYNYLLDKQDLQVNTLESVHTLLHPTFQLAVRDEIIRKNPTDGVLTEIKKSSEQTTDVRHALTIPQQRAFMEHIANHPVYCHWWPLFTVLLGTGCRIGEALGLRWDDLDYERRTININHSNGVQREHNKKLNNGLPILHKVPPKRDYGRYFCIMAEKGGTSHGGLTEKLSPFFHAKKQEVNAYGR